MERDELRTARRREGEGRIVWGVGKGPHSGVGKIARDEMREGSSRTVGVGWGGGVGRV